MNVGIIWVCLKIGRWSSPNGWSSFPLMAILKNAPISPILRQTIGTSHSKSHIKPRKPGVKPSFFQSNHHCLMVKYGQITISRLPGSSLSSYDRSLSKTPKTPRSAAFHCYRSQAQRCFSEMRAGHATTMGKIPAMLSNKLQRWSLGNGDFNPAVSLAIDMAETLEQIGTPQHWVDHILKQWIFVSMIIFWGQRQMDAILSTISINHVAKPLTTHLEVGYYNHIISYIYIYIYINIIRFCYPEYNLGLWFALSQ